MIPRKELAHMRSNSLPNVLQSSLLASKTVQGGTRSSFSKNNNNMNNSPHNNATSDIFTDRMGMIDLNYHDTQKVVRELLEHASHPPSLPMVNERMSEEALEDCHAFADVTSHRKSLSDMGSSLPSLNERMSEDSLEDNHAFSDVHKTTGRTSLSSSKEMKSLEPLDESEFDDEDDEDDEDDAPPSPASRLFPKKKVNLLLSTKSSGAVSMPNIYGLRVSTGGSTSGSYDFDLPEDLVTDHKGLADLEYTEVKKIVDEVLHGSPSSSSNGESRTISETRTSINNITAPTGDEIIVEEDEEDVQEELEQVKEEEETKADVEEATPPSTIPATTEETTPAAAEPTATTPERTRKKGFFQRLKGKSPSIKKFLGNP